MDHFLFRDGALFAEDVPVAEIAAAHFIATPQRLLNVTSACLMRLWKEQIIWSAMR